MLNRIILMGRLPRDPELRHTQTGTAVASFSLAVAPVGALGGRVFEDMDNDGSMGDGVPGAAGVTVRIEGNRTGTVRDITTDETGV